MFVRLFFHDILVFFYQNRTADIFSIHIEMFLFNEMLEILNEMKYEKGAKITMKVGSICISI